MKEYTILPNTTSAEISQWMSDVEKEIGTYQESLKIVEDRLAVLAIERTKLLLEQKELEPNRIKADSNLKNIRQVYKMLERNYFLQGKRGL